MPTLPQKILQKWRCRIRRSASSGCFQLSSFPTQKTVQKRFSGRSRLLWSAAAIRITIFRCAQVCPAPARRARILCWLILLIAVLASGSGSQTPSAVSSFRPSITATGRSNSSAELHGFRRDFSQKFTRSENPGPGFSGPVSGEPVRIRLLNVSPATVFAVASADTAGAVHHFQVIPDYPDDNYSPRGGILPGHVSSSVASDEQIPVEVVDCRLRPVNGRCFSDSTFRSGRAVSGLAVSRRVLCITRGDLPDVRPPFYGEPPQRQRSVRETRESGYRSQSDSAEVTTSRVFLVPWFNHTIPACRAQRCQLLRADNRIVVYRSPEHSSPKTASAEEIAGGSIESQPDQKRLTPEQIAQQISEILENEVLDAVERLLGPVEDVDFNNRLTIVLSELDSLGLGDIDHVQGCVRSSDILTGDADTGGDIIYIDRNLPDYTELKALLAHELTHVAVYSALLRHRLAQAKSGESCPVPSEDMPPWLNEAIAHAVECSIAGESSSFRWRRRVLGAQPAQCPIVTDDFRMTFAARRGGSRAAATLFLNCQSSCTADLRKLLDFQKEPMKRIESYGGCSFERAFRDWTLLLLASSSQADSGSKQSDLELQPVCFEAVCPGPKKEYTVSGTAVRFFRVTHAVDELTLTTTADAAIQISVVLP